MSEKYGTRTDCTRDNRVTLCPNSTSLGYSTHKAKRGSWISYEIDNHHRVARVVGRVHCEGKTYIEVITTDSTFTFGYVRWIEPGDVRECYSGPNMSFMAFITGPWTDVDAILTRAAAGFPRDTLES